MSIALKEAFYQKYIAPTERQAGRFVGVELEYPLVNLSRRPVDIPAVQEVVRGFAERFQFSDRCKDDNGNLYSLTEPVTGGQTLLRLQLQYTGAFLRQGGEYRGPV